VLRGEHALRAARTPELAELEAPPVRHDPANAQAAIEQAFSDARSLGYADGHAEGVAAARAEHHGAISELRMRIDSALAALAAAEADFRRRQETSVADIENEVVEAALTLVEAVLGREVRTATDPGRDALARALALVPPRTPAVCRLYPGDLAALGELGDLEAGRSIELVPDPSVEPAGCVVEAGATSIDGQLGPAVERVKRELL